MKNKKLWITAILLSGMLALPVQAAVISPGSKKKYGDKDGRFTENRRRYGRVRGSSACLCIGIGSRFCRPETEREGGMKKLRWFAITLFLLSVVLYALDQNQIRRKTDQTIPKISMDQDEIQVSVKDPEKVWKKGITAYDEKDGDITDSLVIESVSTFLEKGRRLVSYAAFDRDGHVAKASRQLIYTDYHSPKISCAKPFSFPVGTQDILDSVYATDCIDGDISNKVEITGDSVFFLNIAGEYEIWLQVTNSCGDMVTVPVTLEMVDYRQQTERTKRAEAEKQMERTNLTEKATEETGQKETEGAENGTKAG